MNFTEGNLQLGQDMAFHGVPHLVCPAASCAGSKLHNKEDSETFKLIYADGYRVYCKCLISMCPKCRTKYNHGEQAILRQVPLVLRDRVFPVSLSTATSGSYFLHTDVLRSVQYDFTHRQGGANTAGRLNEAAARRFVDIVRDFGVYYSRWGEQHEQRAGDSVWGGMVPAQKQACARSRGAVEFMQAERESLGTFTLGDRFAGWGFAWRDVVGNDVNDKFKEEAKVLEIEQELELSLVSAKKVLSMDESKVAKLFGDKTGWFSDVLSETGEVTGCVVINLLN